MKKGFFTLLMILVALNLQAAGKSVTYSVDGGLYEGYFTAATKTAPLILLVHDWDGLTDYEVQRAEMLKELGYSVFAVDLFGKGIRPTKNEDKKQHTGELYKDREKMRRLMSGALEKASNLGGNTSKAVVMGYCFGGAAVLEFARAGADAKAFVTFHGGLATPEGQNYAQAKGKIMVFHGTADQAITMDQFAALATDLEKSKIDHEMVTYSGAPHAFTVFGTNRYRETADQNSWKRFTEFLASLK